MMNLNEFKEKVSEFLKEDAEEHPQEKYNFKDSYHYKQITVATGFVVGVLAIMALQPELLTRPMNIVENLTIMGFMIYAFAGYILMTSCERAGIFVVDNLTEIYNGIMNHIKPPQIVSNSLVFILLMGYLAFKILYPVVLGVR